MQHREIKFRAWHKADNSMMTWEEINQSDKDGIIPFLDCLSNPNAVVMQYTGLKDTNGKEIYEGDIVETRLNVRGKPGSQNWASIIRYNEHVGAWQIAYRNSGNDFSTDNIGFRYFLTVIGNIFENPEML